MLESIFNVLRPATLLKRDVGVYRCFPVKISKFLRIPLCWNTSVGCFETGGKSPATDDYKLITNSNNELKPVSVTKELESN